MIAKIKNFLTEITVELKKVAWPSRNELFGSTIVVIIGVAVMAIYIGICDFIFAKAVHLIIR
jgi:preprotein translocase subunit SecE